MINNSYEINEVFKDKDSFIEYLDNYTNILYGKKLSETNDIQKYLALAKLIKTCVLEQWRKTKIKTRDTQSKQLYYFSLEFLLGKMLKNNLMSLGVYNTVKEGLASINIDINTMEEIETDAGLGNGGLGRLAACYLDSLATLEYPGSGNTIRYKNGLFKQLIINNEQVEVPDQWLRIENPWEVRRADKTVDVRFYGYVEMTRDKNGNLEFHRKDTEHILAVPYDMPIVGASTNTANTLRMWSAEASDDLPAGRDYRKYISSVDDICLNLYPDDSTEQGRHLRIKQEYFFVAAGLQSIINEHLKVYRTLDNLSDKVVIQLNDTHPALAIPELMRILIDTYQMTWEKAWTITAKTFAYTNHTVMPEALEKWPVQYIQTIVPRVYQIICEIDKRFREDLRKNGHNNDFIESVAIISEGNMRMANLSIIGSFSVNGVAKLHSEILVKDLFYNFNKLYPTKFNNKTNGITPRRWLLFSNRQLCDVIDKYIGQDYKTDFEKIGQLENVASNPDLQKEFLDVKQVKKEQLAYWLKQKYNITVDPNSVFDTIAKRLHAYKRQSLDIMYVISQYFKIKEEHTYDKPKTTFFFAAKAASSYYFAKKVIKLINCVAEKINNDPEVNKYINVVFIPNYCVSLSEKLMPATDISEQISTAGKEASGTGNMKFMMNGALTLGTYDGANIEIANLVGDDNIVIFGLHEDEIKEKKANGYSAYDIYMNNPVLHKVIDSLTDGTWSNDVNDFKVISDEFKLNNDEYMVLADFDEYCKAHDKVYELYKDKNSWAQKCLINIAKSAFFSSDRAIKEYANEIWNIKSFK